MEAHRRRNNLLLLLTILFLIGCGKASVSDPEVPTAVLSDAAATYQGMVSNAANENVRIRQSGFVSLFADPALPDNPDAHIDLDTGATLDVTGGDIRFVIGQGSGHFYVLEPVNSARAGSVGKNAPSFEGCREAMKSFSSGNIPEIAAGHYFCVLTNQGRLSQLRIDEVDHLGEGSLQISFITWDDTFDTE